MRQQMAQENAPRPCPHGPRRFDVFPLGERYGLRIDHPRDLDPVYQRHNENNNVETRLQDGGKRYGQKQRRKRIMRSVGE